MKHKDPKHATPAQHHTLPAQQAPTPHRPAVSPLLPPVVLPLAKPAVHPTVHASLAKKSTSKPVTHQTSSVAAGMAFRILDNEDGSFTLEGVDPSGHFVDITKVGSITVTSENNAVATVDPPKDMTFFVHGVSDGLVNIVIALTWNGVPPHLAFVLPLSITMTPTPPVVAGAPTVKP
jgi:hypothetical protein